MQWSDPETEPLAFTDLIAIDTVEFFLFLSDIILICHVVDLRRPQLPLIEIQNVHLLIIILIYSIS